jgi:hypothetical protein
MGYLTRHTVTITTSNLGAGVGYTPALNGRIHSIQYVKPASGNYENNVTLAVVGNTTGIAVLALAAGQMDASRTVYPRAQVHLDTTGAALVLNSDDDPVTDLVGVAGETLKLTIAAGGSAKTGTFYVTVTGPTG